MLLSFFIPYLIYNIVAGIVLAFYYYGKYHETGEIKDFLALILFPTYGLGNWLYQRDLREEQEIVYPKRWYVFKNMVKLNWGYIIFMIGSQMLLVMGLGGLVGSGLGWANHQTNALALSFGLLADVGFLFLAVFAFVVVLLEGGILYLILILIPQREVQNIETDFYKQKYYSELQKNKQNSATNKEENTN